MVPAGDPSGDLLIVAWGSTHGPITAALNAQRGKGRRIGHVHLRYLNPLPKNLGEVHGTLRQGAGPGNEHGPAGDGVAREISGRRARLQQDSGQALQDNPKSNARLKSMLDAFDRRRHS